MVDGSDWYTGILVFRVAWVTAATGILVYWCSKHTGGHNFHFVLCLLSYFVYNFAIDYIVYRLCHCLVVYTVTFVYKMVTY